MMNWQQEGKEMENKYGCYACGKEIPTFKETLLIIAKFLQNPKTPKKIIDQAHTDLGKMGDLLDHLDKENQKPKEDFINQNKINEAIQKLEKGKKDGKGN